MQKHSFCIASIANRDHPLEIMNSIANHDRQPPPTSTGPHSPNHQRLIYRWLSGELQLQKPPPTMRMAPATFAALPPTAQREMASPPLLADKPANTTRKTSPYPQATKAHSPSPSGNRSTLHSPTSTADPAKPTATNLDLPPDSQLFPITSSDLRSHHLTTSTGVWQPQPTPPDLRRQQPLAHPPTALPAASTKLRTTLPTWCTTPSSGSLTQPKLERENPSPTTLAILIPEMP